MGFEPGRLRTRRDLPASHTKTWELDLSRNRKAALALNIAALPLFFAFGWIFIKFAALLRPDITSRLFLIRLTPYPSLLFLILIVVVVGAMIVHEAIHGAFFWLFTRSKPIFGLKLLFAYAGAPDWYIPRNPYVVIGMAPFFVITVFGFIVIALAPPAVGQLMLFAVVMNASGAVGDLYVSGKVLFQPREVLIQDTGVGFTMFSPVNDSSLTEEHQAKGEVAHG